MLTGIRIQICLLICLMPVAAVCALQSDGYGPNVKSFLDLMRQEETELEFQIERGEISRGEYTQAKSKIAIMKQTVLDAAKKTGQDIVPELHVVTASEVGQLIEGGTRALRGVKVGNDIAGKWRYLGRAVRGEVFYIFERLARK
jgi:hypothetical protein